MKNRLLWVFFYDLDISFAINIGVIYAVVFAASSITSVDAFFTWVDVGSDPFW